MQVKTITNFPHIKCIKIGRYSLISKTNYVIGNKTVQDVLFEKNNQLRDGNCDSASFFSLCFILSSSHDLIFTLTVITHNAVQLLLIPWLHRWMDGFINPLREIADII